MGMAGMLTVRGALMLVALLPVPGPVTTTL